MRRREFMQWALVPLATVVRPRLASAQARTARIGLLAPGSSATTAEFVQELKVGLREQGLVDGENVRLEPAFGETHQALDDLAVQLVRSNVNLIIAWSTPAVAAAKRATGTVPIVMVGIADPIGARLVESLARPGGNVTGTTNLSRDLGGKILDFLLQIVPQVRRLGILLNPSNEAASLQLRDTEVAAHALGLELHVAHSATASDLGTAVEKLVAERASALVVLPDPLYAAERARLAELALAHRLPSAFSPGERAGWRVAFLRTKLRGAVPPRRRLRRQNLAWSGTRRPSGRAADASGACAQSENGESSRAVDPAVAPDPRR